MRWVFALLCSIGLVLCLPARARAQSAPSFLTVTREAGAESCPDSETLGAHVDRLRGHQATSQPSAYRVRFSYRGGVFRADIQVGDAGAARVLRDRRASCASLEQATALTLALLLDSDASELPLDKPEPEPAAPHGPPVGRALPRPSPPDQRGKANFALALGGGALFGVVQPIAPAVLGELGIGMNRFRTSIGVLWMPTQTRDFGPGQLRETLLSGVAHTCLTTLRSADVRLDFCSGIYAGLLEVAANGYTRNDSVDKAWVAVPVELTVSTTSAPVGVEVGASALLPLRRNDFSIDRLPGVAYESWPVGLLVSMRAVGVWLL
jgi:hypothetical protein